MQRNNNGRGPKYSAPTDSKSVHRIAQVHRSNPYFNIDENGRYWLVKPDRELGKKPGDPGKRPTRERIGEIRNFRDGRKYFKHTEAIVDESYDPRALDKQREQLLAKIMQNRDDDDDIDVDGDTSGKREDFDNSSLFHTRPLKIVDAHERKRFSSLLFHHFLHGLRGLNNSERRPLLVRKAFCSTSFLDSASITRIQHDVVVSNSTKETETDEKSSCMKWVDVNPSVANTIQVPFAVFPHCRLRASTIFEKKSDLSKETLSSSSSSPFSSSSSVLSAVSPFSRAAKHARLTGKPVGLGAANRDQVHTSGGTVKAAADDNNNNNDKRFISAWDPSEIFTTEETILSCAGEFAGVAAFGMEKTVGDGSREHHGVAGSSFTTSAYFEVLMKNDEHQEQRALLGSKDCLFIPRGWSVKVAMRKRDAEVEEACVQQSDNGNQINNKKISTPIDSNVPLLLRFTFSPTFPETGVEDSSIDEVGGMKNKKQQQQRVRYVASDFISSYGDFYTYDPRHQQLSTAARPASSAKWKFSNRNVVSDERMGVMRPMNF